MNPTPSRVELKNGLRMIAVVAESIREAGRVPSGTLYALVMGRMSLEAYEKMIQILKNTGLVSEVAHELIWIGPNLEPTLQA